MFLTIEVQYHEGMFRESVQLTVDEHESCLDIVRLGLWAEGLRRLLRRHMWRGAL